MFQYDATFYLARLNENIMINGSKWAYINVMNNTSLPDNSWASDNAILHMSTCLNDYFVI